jgi:hypothetical protein
VHRQIEKVHNMKIKQIAGALGAQISVINLSRATERP